MNSKQSPQQMTAPKLAATDEITRDSIKGKPAKSVGNAVHWVGASVLVLACGIVYVLATLADKAPEGLLTVLKAWVGGHGF